MNKQLNQKSNVLSSATVVTTMIFYMALSNGAIASSDADYSFVINSDRHNCQYIDAAYQEVYAFETASFYINICQKDDGYFYSGEAKQSKNNSIFIPAYPLENGSGFRAENGNLSYLVLLPFNRHLNQDSSTPQPAEAILTIKRNNRLVAVESSLNKYCHSSSDTVAWDSIELQSQSGQLATIPQQQDIGSEFLTLNQSDRLLPEKVFNSSSRFDFYRIGGELHRLTTCN